MEFEKKYLKIIKINFIDRDHMLRMTLFTLFATATEGITYMILYYGYDIFLLILKKKSFKIKNTMAKCNLQKNGTNMHSIYKY